MRNENCHRQVVINFVRANNDREKADDATNNVHQIGGESPSSSSVSSSDSNTNESKKKESIRFLAFQLPRKV